LPDDAPPPGRPPRDNLNPHAVDHLRTEMHNALTEALNRELDTLARQGGARVATTGIELTFTRGQLRRLFDPTWRPN
jgi:hypothetical protein